MRIIPAIDIIEGKCVRLSKGDYSTKKIYNEDPLEVAKSFEGSGIQFLHLVDLDGAKASKIINWKVLETIANKTNLTIDFGGGVKSDEDLKIAFDAGASQVTGGSIAVKDPDTFKRWLIDFGSDRIILGADSKNGKIAVSGWEEESEIMLKPFIANYLEEGIKYVISTDISKDGMLEGAAVDLYRDLINSFETMALIASGGVTTMEDVMRLDEIGCEGAIIGKAIYEGYISLKQLEKFIVSQ